MGIVNWCLIFGVFVCFIMKCLVFFMIWLVGCFMLVVGMCSVFMRMLDMLFGVVMRKVGMLVVFVWLVNSVRLVYYRWKWKILFMLVL